MVQPPLKTLYYATGTQTFKQHLKVAANEQLRVCVLDLSPNKQPRQIIVDLASHASVELLISTFGAQRTNKAFQVRINHLGDYGQSQVAAYAVAAQTSQIAISLLSDIKKKTTGNAVSQVIRGALLSDAAQIKGEPQLIIDDNDVKATHAMAIGRVDPEQLFYLQSRGISQETALQLILAGYFATVIAAAPTVKQQAEARRKVTRLFATANTPVQLTK